MLVFGFECIPVVMDYFKDDRTWVVF